jgi:hypothetical protein
MFMMPTPPTASDVRAAQTSRPATRFTVACTARMTSVKSRTSKSSSIPGPIWCRSRIKSVICAIAAGISSVDWARTRIESTLANRSSLGVAAFWLSDWAG